MTDSGTSGSGAPIFRHDPEKVKSMLVGGVGRATDLIETHVAKHLGDDFHVFHELVSDLVHVDIYIVDPCETRPFYTLLTSGMSDLPMKTPPGNEEYSLAEIMMCLPAEWALDQESFKQEESYWPIRLMKELARLPHRYDTWLWASHTVPNGDPPRPYAKNTRLCCALLLYPILMPERFNPLEVNHSGSIHFLSLIPIYKEEMDLKLKKGLDSLLDLLEDNGVSELLNPSRRNVCRRKLFGS